DADHDALTYELLSQPTHGTLSGTAPNLSYTSTVPYTGTDQFTFRVKDASTASAPATVTITVQQVNHAPTASDASVTADEGAATPVTLAATDPDGDALSYEIVSQPTHGSLTGTPPNVSYTSDLAFSGNDSFTFKAKDAGAASQPATVGITVKAAP